jgi:hypothetical protein
MMNAETNISVLCRDAATGAEPRPGRLPVDVVQHIHRLVGGDARTEKMVEDFIKFRWQAQNLFYIPPKVASEIIRRPADFLTAVKNHCEPELSFRTGQ